MCENFSHVENASESSRERVIQLLQEQINELLFYKNDYLNIQKRLEISENSLQMKEAEFKLKCDEIGQELKETKKHFSNFVSSNSTCTQNTFNLSSIVRPFKSSQKILFSHQLKEY